MFATFKVNQRPTLGMGDQQSLAMQLHRHDRGFEAGENTLAIAIQHANGRRQGIRPKQATKLARPTRESAIERPRTIDQFDVGVADLNTMLA
ncbi:hypothetical protein D9M71_842240 [compost metagenome]